MKQNPCRYCALSWEHRGKHYPSYEHQCKECAHIKKHAEYLKSKRMFEPGEQIKTFDELGHQLWVFVGAAHKASHIEVIKSWQLRIVLNLLNEGKFYKATRKNVEPVAAGEREE